MPLTGQAKKDYQREWMRRKRAKNKMYKDKGKQRKTQRERQRRYRKRHKMYKDKDKQRDAVKFAQRRLRLKRKGATIMQELAAREGYVYLIQCVGFPYYKIGTSLSHPKERLKILQIGVPFELKLIKAVRVTKPYEAEYYLQELYKTKAVRGEWFNFTDIEISDVLAKYEHVSLFYRMIA